MSKERPKIKDYFGKDATLSQVHQSYANSPELFKYTQALDSYIDELESTPPVQEDKSMEEIIAKHIGNPTTTLRKDVEAAMQSYATQQTNKMREALEEAKVFMDSVNSNATIPDGYLETYSNNFINTQHLINEALKQ